MNFGELKPGDRYWINSESINLVIAVIPQQNDRIKFWIISGSPGRKVTYFTQCSTFGRRLNILKFDAQSTSK